MFDIFDFMRSSWRPEDSQSVSYRKATSGHVCQKYRKPSALPSSIMTLSPKMMHSKRLVATSRDRILRIGFERAFRSIAATPILIRCVSSSDSVIISSAGLTSGTGTGAILTRWIRWRKVNRREDAKRLLLGTLKGMKEPSWQLWNAIVGMNGGLNSV